MIDSYYYRDAQRKTQGPLTRQQLAQLILDGKATIHTQVWDVALDHGGLGAWQPAWLALGYPREPGTMKPARGA
ncbi:MAG: DUF4339 domain-containing protein [Lentisphaerae bacterium]|nr:DUF4339 domain-containing protein [Lentisphaerota bacterium]